MSDLTSIMIVGVGGQGTLLASRVIGSVLLSQGFDVKVSEIHGMSQRGGSVVTYVKYGERVYSPVIDRGEADYMLAFERLEAARWLPWLKKGGSLLLNDQRLSPMPVITGAMQYPDNIVEKIHAKGVALQAIDALALAAEAGSSMAVNVVLLGLLSSSLPFPESSWQAALAECVKARFLEVNRMAFELGRKAL